MSVRCTLRVEAWNAPTVLPRILLAFSRRRLPIVRLRFAHEEAERPARMRIEVDCDEAVAAEVARQLRRIVEVRDVALAPRRPAAAVPPAA